MSAADIGGLQTFPEALQETLASGDGDRFSASPR